MELYRFLKYCGGFLSLSPGSLDKDLHSLIAQGYIRCQFFGNLCHLFLDLSLKVGAQVYRDDGGQVSPDPLEIQKLLLQKSRGKMSGLLCERLILIR